jgi:hypothetical protein
MIPAAASPTAAASVTIESADPNPATGTQDLEHLVIQNNSPDAVDLSEWSLAGGGLHHTFKAGTVLVGTAITSTLNRATVCNNRAAFRSRPGAPTTAEYLLGDYDGALSARGGTVELRTATGTVVSRFSLPIAPTAAQQQLRITTLMYAPTAPTAAERAASPTVNAQDFEYIELRNIGTTPLSLAGCRFTDGINFTFPADTTLAAGARLVIAAHLTAFDLRYGHNLPRLGPFTGTLDNAGERVRLVDAVGEEILDFSFSPDWFPASHTHGYALVMRDDANTSESDWGRPEKWALSSTPGGTPAETDAFFSYEYAGWKNYVFSEADRANPAVSNPDVTLHGSTVSNLLAFALTADPHSPNPAQLPTFTIVTDGALSYPALRFRQWKNTPGLTLTLETAASLAPGTWQSGGHLHETTDHQDGTLTVTLRDTVPISQAAGRFLRLKASLP